MLRPLLILFVSLEIVLLSIGIGATPPSVSDVQEVVDTRGRLIAIFPQPGEEQEILLTRLDDAGLPVQPERTELQGLVIANLSDRLFMFSDGGVTEIRETEDQGFSADRFFPQPPGHRLLSASGAGDAIIVAGLDAQGRLVVDSWDGYRFAAITQRGRVPEGHVRGAAFLLDDHGEGFILLRSDQMISTGSVRENSITWSGSAEVGAGGERIELIRGESGPVAFFSLDHGDAGRSIVQARPGPSEVFAEPVTVVELTEGQGGWLAGTLDGGRLQGVEILVASEGGVRSVDQDGEERAAPTFLAAWNASESSFWTPLLFQMFFFVVIGLLGRRPLRLPKEAEEVLMIRPASVFRRFLALMVDLALVGSCAWGICIALLGGPETRYLEAVMLAAEPDVLDPVLVGIQQNMMFLGLMLLFFYFAICDAVGGRTLGKKLFGLRVIGIDGLPPGLGPSATRSVLFYLDGPWTLGLGGLVSVVLTRKRQRIGDIFGGTIVVSEETASRMPQR